MYRFTKHRDRVVETQVKLAEIRDRPAVRLPLGAVPARRSLNEAAHKLSPSR